MKQQIY